MKTLTYNQFQSLYDLQGFYVLVDFLNNSITNYAKDDHVPKYLFDEVYQNKMNELNVRVKSILQPSKTLEITLILDLKCNMKCVYCYEAALNKENEQTKLDKKHIIDFISMQWEKGNYELLRINILGGEPIMPHNIEYLNKLVNEIHQIGIPVSIIITTNGLTISEYVESITSWKVKQIQVTLDGVEGIHNLRRIPCERRNGFRDIITGISMLIEKGIFVNIRVNVDKNNAAGLPDLARYFISQSWQKSFYSVYIYPITMSGRKDYVVNNNEAIILNLVLNVLNELPIDLRNVYNLDFYGIIYIDYIIDGRQPLIISKFCGATNGQYVIQNDGYVRTCWWALDVNKFIVANLLSNSHYKQYEDNFNDFMNRSVLKMHRCVSCKFKFICGAGCVYKEWKNRNTLYYGNCSEFDTLISAYLEYRLFPNCQSASEVEFHND